MPDRLGRLLIVDDEQPVLDVLGEYFTTQGYDVETAGNGTDALMAVERQRPDLVLLDVRMPGMDGLEVLKRLRAQDRELAVIMVTANEDVALARETLKIGAFDYVSKPFDFRYLDRAVGAGLLHDGTVAAPAPALTPLQGGAGEDPWRRLALAVFRATRALSPTGRASTGEPLERAALAAAREAWAGEDALAARRLREIDLLLAVSADLGDLPVTARTSIETALGAARKALPGA